jgi:cell division septation protein DedD
MHSALTTEGLWDRLRAGIGLPHSVAAMAEAHLALYRRVLGVVESPVAEPNVEPLPMPVPETAPAPEAELAPTQDPDPASEPAPMPEPMAVEEPAAAPLPPSRTSTKPKGPNRAARRKATRKA